MNDCDLWTRPARLGRKCGVRDQTHLMDNTIVLGRSFNLIAFEFRETLNDLFFI